MVLICDVHVYFLQMGPKLRLPTPRGNPSPAARAPEGYPWPNKEENKAIDINDPMLLDYNVEGWDKDSAAKYNKLLKAEISPTKFAHADPLANLGLDTDVFETLASIGLAGLCYRVYPLYPDLVRQVLATCQVTYRNPTAPTYENCSFSFMADGKFCSISLQDLNELYEISDEPRGVSVDKKFVPQNAFWDLIAAGKFTPRKAYQSQIRNPTIRVLAKIISNTLFAKEYTSKVTSGELQVLYTCLEDEIRRDQVIPVQEVRTNPGFHLISMFAERKNALLRTDDKKDRSGSLLTPLFEHFNINLSAYKVVSEIEYIDTPYLLACHILRDERTYMFQDKEGNSLYCQLPMPGFTNFLTLDNIMFLPPAEQLCPDPRAPPPKDDDDMDDVEDVTPTDGGDFDLDPHLDLDDEAAYRKWMVDSQRKNNSLMKKILRLITGGCFAGQSGQEEQRTPQTTHRPGKEPAGPSGGDVRLARNRRTTGNESGGSD